MSLLQLVGAHQYAMLCHPFAVVARPTLHQLPLASPYHVMQTQVGVATEEVAASTASFSSVVLVPYVLVILRYGTLDSAHVQSCYEEILTSLAFTWRKIPWGAAPHGGSAIH